MFKVLGMPNSPFRPHLSANQGKMERTTGLVRPRLSAASRRHRAFESDALGRRTISQAQLETRSVCQSFQEGNRFTRIPEYQIREIFFSESLHENEVTIHL
jgi:hypothetical protein